MDFTNLLTKLTLKENFAHGLPQSEGQIHDLETKLNVQFPQSYKDFLRRYGYMSWLGGEIYGPSDDEYCDLLIRNKEAREINLPKDFFSLHKDAFVIKGYLGGGYYMIFSADSPRAGQVGLFLGETAYHEEQTWDSFEAFLKDYYCP